MTDININWFPGHMKKATDEINKIINNIDLVIEVVDARCIEASSNDTLIATFNNKPIIKIALKADLSDIKQTDTDTLLISTKNKADKNRVIERLNAAVIDKVERLQKKGLVNPSFSILVVGLPNVGKSSLINFLGTKSTLIAENRAGVTKKQSMRKINDRFYLIDTPGIFVKKINAMEVGYQLALINTINKTILPLTSINQYYHQYMMEHYAEKYMGFFKLKEKLAYPEFIEFIGQTMNFKTKGNTIDIDKVEDYLFNIYTSNNICRYHFHE